MFLHQNKILDTLYSMLMTLILTRLGPIFSVIMLQANVCYSYDYVSRSAHQPNANSVKVVEKSKRYMHMSRQTLH